MGSQEKKKGNGIEQTTFKNQEWVIKNLTNFGFVEQNNGIKLNPQTETCIVLVLQNEINKIDWAI